MRRSLAVVIGTVACGLALVSIALMLIAAVYDFRWTCMLFAWRWTLPFGLGDPSMSDTFWTGTVLTVVCAIPGGIGATLADSTISRLWDTAPAWQAEPQ